jgi:hypothetical protein
MILANPVMEIQMLNAIYVQMGIFRQTEHVSNHVLQDTITRTNFVILVIKIV